MKHYYICIRDFTEANGCRHTIGTIISGRVLAHLRPEEKKNYEFYCSILITGQQRSSKSL